MALERRIRKLESEDGFEVFIVEDDERQQLPMMVQKKKTSD